MTVAKFKISEGDQRPKTGIDKITVFNKSKHDTKKQPMFFGQPLGVQRYDAFKYPVFDRLTNSQLGFFWRPEEVSLQKDRSDFQDLSDAQKHIFTSNLRYQILLDSYKVVVLEWHSFHIAHYLNLSLR